MTQQIQKSKNDIIFFIERFCYIKDNEINIHQPIKLSKAQKRILRRLIKLKKKK